MKDKNIKKPDHYTCYGFECKDIIELLGNDYYIGNVFKYLYRAGVKDESPIEDVKKALQYIEFYEKREKRLSLHLEQVLVALELIEKSTMPEPKITALIRIVWALYDNRSLHEVANWIRTNYIKE